MTSRSVKRAPEKFPGKAGKSKRKRRTRAHVLAEISANHVERHVLACAYAVERVEHDYGIDLILLTYDRLGNWQNGFVFLQLKATDRLRLRVDGTISFTVDRADLEWWLEATDPVILIVYDAATDRAYWLYSRLTSNHSKVFVCQTSVKRLPY